MIKELRQQLVTDLGALGVPVHNAWPERPALPSLVVVPPTAGNYVIPGATFGQFVVAMDVLAVVERNRQALNKLDELIEKVLANTVDWAVEGVETPSLVTVGPLTVLGCVVSLAKPGFLE